MPGRTRFDQPYERVEYRLRSGLRSHPSVRRAVLDLAALLPTVIELEPSDDDLLIDRSATHYARCVCFTVTRLRGAFSYHEIDYFARTVHRDLVIERGASDPQLRHGRVAVSVPVGSLVDRYGREGSRKRRGPTDAQVDSAVDALAKSLDRGRRGQPDDLDADERQAISRVMRFIGRPGFLEIQRDRRMRPAAAAWRTTAQAAAAAKRGAEAARKRASRHQREHRQAVEAERERLEAEVAAGRLYRWTQDDLALGEFASLDEANDEANGIYTSPNLVSPYVLALSARLGALRERTARLQEVPEETS